tara:strand:+ start:86 stop:274 length:189 start_codon:yes stop_codon:yes gene_type:complete
MTENKNSVTYIMTEEVRAVILKYMYTRPYQEVAQGIAVLSNLPKLDPKINPTFVQDEKPKNK